MLKGILLFYHQINLLQSHIHIFFLLMFPCFPYSVFIEKPGDRALFTPRTLFKVILEITGDDEGIFISVSKQVYHMK